MSIETNLESISILSSQCPSLIYGPRQTHRTSRLLRTTNQLRHRRRQPPVENVHRSVRKTDKRVPLRYHPNRAHRHHHHASGDPTPPPRAPPQARHRARPRQVPPKLPNPNRPPTSPRQLASPRFSL